MKLSEYSEITESLNRPVKVSSQGIFTVGGNQYEIDIEHRPRINSLIVDFVALNPDGSVAYDMRSTTGTADAMTVFATVIDHVSKVAEEKGATRITFTAFDDQDKADSDKRLRLYSKMTQRWAKEHNWDVLRNDRRFVLTKK